MALVASKKPTASTPHLAQRRDGALSLTIECSTRHWLDPFARVKSSLLLKIHGPSARELANNTADCGNFPITGIRTHVPTCQKVTRLPTELPGRQAVQFRKRLTYIVWFE